MPSEDKPASAEREQTDASLRLERQKSDDKLAEKLAVSEENADAVVEKARTRADAVLVAGRTKMDEDSASPLSVNSSNVLERERGLEDEVVREERADADEVLRTERADEAAVVETKRDTERDATDDDLLHERSRYDDAVSTRDDFLGMVSHDLRNLLGTVIGFAALIAQAESGETEHRPEQVLSYARRIERAGARMERLIGDLVDVASIEAGMLGVAPEPLDARHVVEEAVENFQKQASANGISLVAEKMTASSVATFDPARILQVLVNLLGNAIKFTQSGGAVVVRLECTAEELRFSVRDTGMGIAADRLGEVFDRFSQLKADDRRGVGLGLYISKSIVKRHGGRIGVESRLGEGSTFWFTLPGDVGSPPAA